MKSRIAILENSAIQIKQKSPKTERVKVTILIGFVGQVDQFRGEEVHLVKSNIFQPIRFKRNACRP